MDANNLVERLLAKIKSRRRHILVVGDTMTDRWIHGHTEECQDGCKKFVQTEVVDTFGGAANANHSISNWNIHRNLCGFSETNRPVKVRYIENGKIVFRADDDGPKTRGAAYGWARNMAVELAQHADAVLLSDYDKGFLTPGFIEAIAGICKHRNVPCVADCKRAPELYRGCILKCNEVYYKNNFDRMVNSAQYWVTTYGDRTPYIQGVKGETLCELTPVNCINHVGAGDCFSAHLTLALACGFLLRDAAALAHSAGRVYVQHEHNRPPRPEEIAVDLAMCAV